MKSDSEFGLFEEGFQECLVGACLAQRRSHRLSKVQHVVGYEVRQIGILRVVPDLFVWVKFRCVSGKPLDHDTSTKSPLQSTHTRLVNLPAIEDQRDRPSEPAKQVCDKFDKVVRDDVVINDVKVEAQSLALRRDRKRRNGRQSVVPVPTIEHRSFATRGPSASHGRLQHKARFVEKYDRSAATSRVFLSEANRAGATGQWRPRLVRALGARAPGLLIYG